MSTMTPLRHRQLVTGGDPDKLFLAPEEAAFKQAKSDFLPADAIERLVTELIHAHDRFKPLRGKHLIVRWRVKSVRTPKGDLHRKVDLPSAFWQHGAEADLGIWLSAAYVRTFQLTAWQVEAELFSALCGVSWNTKTNRAVVVHPDFLGFNAELRQYGAWRVDLEKMLRNAKQLDLFDIMDAAE